MTDEATAPPEPSDSRPRITRRPAAIAGAFLAAVAVPFVITALRLRHPRPYVVLDLAQTELRVRAVFSANPPLIGLPGRLGHFGVHTGSHPGPLSFWVLAPFYKLFGSTPWALFAAALVVNFAWIAVALWLGWRRGRVAMLVGVGTLVLVLVHAFGIIVVEQPWNPYLPLMAWTVVLLAAWSVLDDDIVMLPVLVAAASWCMQTHIPYLGMGGGIVAVTVLVTILWRYRRRRIVAATEGSIGGYRRAWLTGDPDSWPSLRKLWKWIVGSLVLGLVLWAPPIFDQLHSNEGNFTLIWEDLTDPPQAAGGLVQGVHLVLAHLDPWQLLTGHRIEFVVLNSNWPGAVFLVVWLVAAVFAWRFRVRALVLANLLLGVALVFAVLALSKIYGDLYWYLMMWMWAICAGMVATIVWTVIEAVRRAELPADVDKRVRLASSGVLAVGLAALFVSLTAQASRATIPDRNLSDQMARLVPPTIAALRAGTPPCDGTEGKYLVTWLDPVKIGSGGYTMLDALDGAGFDVGLRPTFLGIVPGRQTVPQGTERCIVHLAVGDPAIAQFQRTNPDAVRVAFYDGRTPARKAEYERLRATARRLIAESGGDPDVIDKSLTGASLDTRLPLAATQAMSKMSEIGLPMAVFLAPPWHD